MSVARQHAEWLSLLEVSGPFLSLEVVQRVFPQGLDSPPAEGELRRALRAAYEEWAAPESGWRVEPRLHELWLRFVLREVLGWPQEWLAEGEGLPAGLEAPAPDPTCTEVLRPDLALLEPEGGRPRLLVQFWPPTQSLEKAPPRAQWLASPATRMMELLHACGVRLGLVTNGERWMLVHAPRGETTCYVTWSAPLWLEEPLTLRSFWALLSPARLFGVPPEETLEGLLDQSAAYQQEVTTQLGYQVRRALEVLVQSLDEVDRDMERSLLRSVSEEGLFEAALTVMMRLVVLLSAEERGLLLLGHPIYDQHYAVSTLQAQLRELADQVSEEVLERRFDAWSRLLATFRLVFAGSPHPELELPAYGGSLFDPDRFPFLEGRPQGSLWYQTPARPPRVHNRTVLHLLEALQFLEARGLDGSLERRRVSFRALDVEQIGHVYEGLLDHGVRRASEPILGLAWPRRRECELPLSWLEERAAAGREALLASLAERTGTEAAVLARALDRPPEQWPFRLDQLRTACNNDEALFGRVCRFAGLLRTDTFGRPLVILPGSFYVTEGPERRLTGTHYTPRWLTEELVRSALEPLVYEGLAEGRPREEWRLRSPRAILGLRVCDFAMGSGAILVQVGRFLAEKLQEAWRAAEEAEALQARVEARPARRLSLAGEPLPAGDEAPPAPAALPPEAAALPSLAALTPEGLPRSQELDEPLPAEAEEREALALRLVAEHCLYGVDRNPLAVQMAQVSLWLVTMRRGRPLPFLGHALRCGDALLGLHLRQVLRFSLAADSPEQPWLGELLRQALALALERRRRIHALAETDLYAVALKQQWQEEAEAALALLRLGADLLVALELLPEEERRRQAGRLLDEYHVLVTGLQEVWHQPLTALTRAAQEGAYERLRALVDALLGGRRPFHWCLEFPEVFVEDLEGSLDEPRTGFMALVSNPPFMGGQRITGALGRPYREYLVRWLAGGRRGSADLCAYFYLRATELVRPGGLCGLLATNTIAQGDTREVGLEQIVARGWSIVQAVRSRRWPGEASLEVAQVWLYRGSWGGPCRLDERPVAAISPFLTAGEEGQGRPYRLAANAGKSFIGSYVLGMGFVLSPEEAAALLARDPRNREVLFPYLNGEDLNSRPDQSPSRWVINFHDWPLERAEQYPACLQIVRQKVKPQRERQNDRQGKEKWWRFLRTRPELHAAIEGKERVLVIALVTTHLAAAFCPTGWVYAHKCCVFVLDKWQHFALIQSSIHEIWARSYSSTLARALNYSPSDCFETFPFPEEEGLRGLEEIGQRYYERRQAIMRAWQVGLTQLYNSFHDPRDERPEILELRALHRQMDQAVAGAYGWSDLDLGHGFHQTPQGLRYTLSPEARRAVLQRLLALNHRRYAHEVALGLHSGGPARGKSAARPGAPKGERPRPGSGPEPGPEPGPPARRLRESAAAYQVGPLIPIGEADGPAGPAGRPGDDDQGEAAPKAARG
ncbi:type IIL restriction-modification enzyme MmeI [Thermogemmatispora sp.]|uniref:type IIL restriction-modification enzyme MmeI n=1 Tax=Thermogemmatispora sp. TaxID=1968838 RepID=UPI0035E4646A